MKSSQESETGEVWSHLDKDRAQKRRSRGRSGHCRYRPREIRNSFSSLVERIRERCNYSNASTLPLPMMGVRSRPTTQLSAPPASRQRREFRIAKMVFSFGFLRAMAPVPIWTMAATQDLRTSGQQKRLWYGKQQMLQHQDSAAGHGYFPAPRQADASKRKNRAKPRVAASRYEVQTTSYLFTDDGRGAQRVLAASGAPVQVDLASPSATPTFEPSIEISNSPPSPSPKTVFRSQLFAPSAIPSHAISAGPSILPSASTSSPVCPPSVSPHASTSALPTHSSQAISSSPTPFVTSSPTPFYSGTFLPSSSASEGEHRDRRILMDLSSIVPTSLPPTQLQIAHSSEPTPGSSSSEPTAPSSFSFAPSTKPSISPPVDHSDGPSEPCVSFSLSPSTSPSYSPSESASLKPSFSPSVASTTKEPSLQPSKNPSEKPSLLPSAFPSPIPSTKPSLKPTDEPTAHPSPQPSAFPTTKPSSGPSYAPSNAPSQQPSGRPSGRPSVLPSELPSGRPSEEPSALPSAAQPSVMTTVAPNITCKDSTTYRSPINNLTCTDHQGTDCTQWHHVGLPLAAVFELIEQCPESCEIECGTFTAEPTAAFTAAPSSSPTLPMVDIVSYLEFLISSVPGMMNTDVQGRFEKLTMQYFSIFTAEHGISSNLVVQNVTVVSQEIIRSTRFLRQQPRAQVSEPMVPVRFLEGNTQLKVNTSIAASSRLLSSTMLTDLLISASDTSVLTDIIRSEPFFASSNVTFPLGVAPGVSPSPGVAEEPTESSAKTTAAIVLSSIAGFAVMGFAMKRYIVGRRNWHNTPEDCSEIASPKSLRPLSPDVPEIDAQLKQGSIFSFEESPCNADPTEPSTTFSRLLGSRSPSNDSTSSCSPSSQEAKSAPVPTTTNDPPQSPSAISPVGPQKCIPPMIVIDNIEQNGSNDCEVPQAAAELRQSQSRETGDSEAPVRHFEASSMLAAALTGCRTPNAPATLADMLFTITSNEGDEEMADSARPTSPPCLGVLSDETMDDDGSAVSTPAKALDTEFTVNGVAPRRCISSNALNAMEPSDALDELIHSEWDQRGLSKTNEKELLHSKSFPDQSLSRADCALSRRLSQDVLYEEGMMQLSKNHASSIREDTATKASREVLLATPPRHQRSHRMSTRHIETDFGEATGDAHSVVSAMTNSPLMDGSTKSAASTSRSTSVDMIVANSSKSSHRDSPTLSEEFLGTNDASSIPPLPFLQHNRRNSLGSSQQHPESRDSQVGSGFCYTFDAPNSGKLGIIIESSRNLGPTIHTVKDYSPLFGLVEAGDKIVKVDGEDTDNMSTGEVTRLLARRRASNANGVIQITVFTFNEKIGFTCDGDEQDDASCSSEKSNERSASEPGHDSSFHLLGATASDDDAENTFHLIGGEESDGMD